MITAATANIPWMNPSITGINRLPARPYLFPYASAEQALAREPEASPWVHMLNGQWKFQFVDKPQAVPEDSTGLNCDDSSWPFASAS